MSSSEHISHSAGTRPAGSYHVVAGDKRQIAYFVLQAVPAQQISRLVGDIERLLRESGGQVEDKVAQSKVMNELDGLASYMAEASGSIRTIQPDSANATLSGEAVTAMTQASHDILKTVTENLKRYDRKYE